MYLVPTSLELRQPGGLQALHLQLDRPMVESRPPEDAVCLPHEQSRVKRGVHN
jgi:hypothetical protein